MWKKWGEQLEFELITRKRVDIIFKGHSIKTHLLSLWTTFIEIIYNLPLGSEFIARFNCRVDISLQCRGLSERHNTRHNLLFTAHFGKTFSRGWCKTSYLRLFGRRSLDFLRIMEGFGFNLISHCLSRPTQPVTSGIFNVHSSLRAMQGTNIKGQNRLLVPT